ncbi:putative CRISPR-associated protein, Cse2 family [Candidatus Accumulibacter aalborgensis]|uniref:Putative CRISPR-associated protein, Cse2 family n=1 Tax=Candidatus Accumulibacter aalborgensis TaxID=1860102 RepID=A0A1A8XX94_9PROT|nr:type I-E CRISPR-associated protein Cse2/CasB [Candidatus Accumulibacter aalborgensis]SBT08648.1 putative CRISPR-associated protein, Cse2 family [Candidatus Accumulibacter aalborgensis]
MFNWYDKEVGNLRPTALGGCLLEWWKDLEDDRASRAILRRADSVTSVALSAPYQRLYRRLLNVGWPENAPAYRNDHLAALVALLAHVRGDVDGKKQKNGVLSLPEAMSVRKKETDRPVVSELRFLRLLDSPDLEDLFTGLRRVLPLLVKTVDGKALDILALADDVLSWSDSVKKRWAYAYQWPDKTKQ